MILYSFGMTCSPSSHLPANCQVSRHLGDPSAKGSLGLPVPSLSKSLLSIQVTWGPSHLSSLEPSPLRAGTQREVPELAAGATLLVTLGECGWRRRLSALSPGTQ